MVDRDGLVNRSRVEVGSARSDEGKARGTDVVAGRGDSVAKIIV